MAAVDLADPELREELARKAYYSERLDEAAVDRETDLSPNVEYFCLQWECLSAAAQRPYRTTVAATLDALETLGIAT